jgi:hypothetical protein
MNILLIILAVLASLIALVLIIALFSKKEYSIARDITIDKPNQQVFDYVRLLKNQDHYSKWVMMDPNAKKVFRGTDGARGFVAAWDSENKQVGKGEQEIKNIIDGEKVEMEIRFEKPFKSVSPAYIATDNIGSGTTKVTWGFNGKMSYPMNAVLLFINIPELLSKDLDESLVNLKTILEKK